MLDKDGHEWAKIPGFDNYRINQNGDLQSIAIGRVWQPKKRYTEAKGYQFYSLGRGNRKAVHHLVMFAFVGPRPAGMECRHLDGDPTNNHLSNLKWGTPAENHADQKIHGTRVKGETHPKAKISDKQRAEIKQRYQSGELQWVLAKEYGLAQPTISYLVNH